MSSRDRGLEERIHRAKRKAPRVDFSDSPLPFGIGQIHTDNFECGRAVSMFRIGHRHGHGGTHEAETLYTDNGQRRMMILAH